MTLVATTELMALPATMVPVPPTSWALEFELDDDTSDSTASAAGKAV